MAATIANAHRDPKRRPRAFKPEDFMPHYGPKRSNWEDQLAYVRELNAMFRTLNRGHTGNPDR